MANATEQLTSSAISQDRIAIDEITIIKDLSALTNQVDTDELVDQLAEDIRIQGLINPLTIDRDGQLLAGHRRLRALRQLRDNHPQEFDQRFQGGQIPVQRVDFSAQGLDDHVIRLMVGENGIRRSFTREDVNHIFQRILDARNIKVQAGRPKKGTVAPRQVLAELFGRSIHWAKAITQERKPDSDCTVSSPKDPTDDCAGGALKPAGASKSRKPPKGRTADVAPQAQASTNPAMVVGKSTATSPRSAADASGDPDLGRTASVTSSAREPGPGDAADDHISEQIDLMPDDQANYVHQPSPSGTMEERSEAFLEAQRAVALIPAHERAEFLAFIQRMFQNSAA